MRWVMWIYLWDKSGLLSVRVFYSGAPQAWETSTGRGRISLKEDMVRSFAQTSANTSADSLVWQQWDIMTDVCPGFEEASTTHGCTERDISDVRWWARYITLNVSVNIKTYPSRGGDNALLFCTFLPNLNHSLTSLCLRTTNVYVKMKLQTINFPLLPAYRT